MRWLLALVVTVASASCYSPRFPRCGVQCGEGAEPCPSGTSCQDGFCLAEGEAACPANDAAAADGGFPAGSFVELSVGAQHACAIDGDGGLWCWGRNDTGQLGQSDTDPRGAATRVGDASDWIEVSAGAGHTCGIRGEQAAGVGALWCWGYNADGQVGNTQTGQYQQLNPVAIAAGTEWRHVAAGNVFTCGLHADRSLWCWGSNVEGQLASGTLDVPTHAYSPLEVTGSTSWTELAAGDYHACGLQTGGTLTCWGWGDEGRLGYGDEVSRPDADTALPPPPGSTWVHVAAGDHHTCATSADFDVYCWGRNDIGQVDGAGGVGVVDPTLVPVIAGDWDGVAVGGQHSCAFRSGEVTCWGYNQAGQGGGVPGGGLGARTTVVTGAIDVGAGLRTTCALLADQTVQCWGDNGWGQVGGGTIADKRVPVRVGAPGEPWNSVDVGIDHTCAINEARELWCWGRNIEAQLGLGHSDPVFVPTRVTAPAIDWIQVAAGDSHSCAVGDTDDLFCWGTESQGQTGAAGTSAVPVEIENSHEWAQVTAGTDTTCAVTTIGERACFGRNSEGQKGRGDTLDINTVQYFAVPDPVDWSVAGLGVFTACAISVPADNAQLYCWGDDTQGQLGDGTPTASPTTSPTLTAAGEGWTEIHQALFHACGLRAGEALCWGYGPAVGADNESTVVPLPWSVGGTDWLSIETGSDFSCGVRTDGTLYCWGLNHTGQLGNGGGAELSLDTVPAGDIGGGEFARVAAGAWRGCAIKRGDATGAPAGSLWCWGENLFGGVGDGTGGAFTPTVVVRAE